jgi:hypothetical protein
MTRQMSVMQHPSGFSADGALKNVCKINEGEKDQCKRKSKGKRTWWQQWTEAGA